MYSIIYAVEIEHWLCDDKWEVWKEVLTLQMLFSYTPFAEIWLMFEQIRKPWHRFRQAS